MSELTRLRKELRDLESLVAELSPPLDPRALDIAMAKIKTLLAQIDDLQRNLSS